MGFSLRAGRHRFVLVVGALIAAALCQQRGAEAATRILPAYGGPGVTITISINLDAPPGTTVVAVEDAPPTGWLVTSVSDSGVRDALSAKVKWGLFFDPSIPATVTYDLTPPDEVTGDACFSGTASYDGTEETLTGDECLATDIPTLSEWGLIVMALALLIIGTRAIAVHGTRSMHRTA